MKCLKWQKVTLQLTRISFLQNRKVCFNQESFPILYHNFHHMSLVRPNSKLKRISNDKLQGQFFTERWDSHSRSHKITKLTKIFGRKLRSDLYLHPKWPNITNIHFRTYMGWFSCRTVILILVKRVTNNLPKFPEQKFGQTQQQIFNLSKISINKLQDQFSTARRDNI